MALLGKLEEPLGAFICRNEQVMEKRREFVPSIRRPKAAQCAVPGGLCRLSIVRSLFKPRKARMEASGAGGRRALRHFVLAKYKQSATQPCIYSAAVTAIKVIHSGMAYNIPRYRKHTQILEAELPPQRFEPNRGMFRASRSFMSTASLSTELVAAL